MKWYDLDQLEAVLIEIAQAVFEDRRRAGEPARVPAIFRSAAIAQTP